MANAIPIGTRIVVVPVFIDIYDAPDDSQAATSSGYEPLPKIAEDLDKLRHLFGSPAYIAEGFHVLSPISGTSGQIKDQLTELQRFLARTPDLRTIIFWSGHGRTVRDELRLLTRECFDPPNATDGLGPAEVVGKVADANLSGLMLLLDVCQAGSGLDSAVSAAGDRARHRKPDEGFFFAALSCAYPFEQAADGFFVGLLVDMLRNGPSPEILAKVLEDDGRDLFSLNSKRVSLWDVEYALGAVVAEINASAPRKRQTPLGVHLGAHGANVFPNPRYQRIGPSRIVASSRRLLSIVDLDEHFLPKARGLEPGEDGWYFSGRSAVTQEIVQWLNLEPGHVSVPLFILTGDGGTGKSAVVGRIAALSDAASRDKARMAGWSEASELMRGIVPNEGCLQAALHLRRMTVRQVTDALGELLDFVATDPTSLVAAATERARASAKPPTLMLDALDEADEPLGIIDQLVLPLIDRGWRVLLATRRSAAQRGAPDLLEAIGAAHVRSLDDETSTPDDIDSYVRRRITDAGRPGLAAIAVDLGSRIAERAQGKFLYARITTSALLRGVDQDLGDIDALLGRDITDALNREVRGLDEAYALRFQAEGGASALLGALAWSFGDGLPWRDGVWAAVAGSLGNRGFEDTHIRWILQEAGHLVVEGGDGEQPVYRLYHQSLVDHFRRGEQPSTAIEVAASLRALGESTAPWRVANPYVVRHLAAHLEQAGDFAALQALLLDAAWASAQVSLNGFNALLGDFERAPRDSAVAKLMLPALRRSAGVLRRNPGEFAAQVAGRLLESKSSLGGFVTDLAKLQRAPWLRPLTPSLRAEGSVQSMRGHSREVLSYVFLSRNGMWAVYSHDGGIMLLDLQRWESRGARLQVKSAYTLALSDDAKTCLIGDLSGRVWTWRAGRGQLQPVQAHGDLDVIGFLDISAKGGHGISATSDGAFAWDLETLRHESIWQGRGVQLTAMALDSAGQVAAFGFADGTIRLFDLWPVRATRSVVVEGQPLALAFSHHKSTLRLAIGTSADRIELRDAGKLDRIIFHQVIDGQPRCVAASGDVVAVGTESGTVEIWSVRGARSARYVKGHTYEVERIAFAEGSTFIVSADRLDVKQWRVTGPGAEYGTAVLSSDRIRVSAMDMIAPRRREAMSPVLALRGGQQIAVVVQGKILAVGGLQEPDSLSIIGNHVSFEAQRFELTQAEAADRVLVWAHSGVAVWDLEKRKLLGCHSANNINDAAISVDGSAVAFISGQRVMLWRPDDGQSEAIGQYADDAPQSICFSRSGDRVLTCGGSRDVRIWQLDETEEERALGPTSRALIPSQDKPSHVLCLADDVAVVATGDGAIFIVDPRSEYLATAHKMDESHLGAVYSMLPFDQGRQLATSSADGTVRLWDLVSRRCTVTLSLGRGFLHCLDPARGLMLMTTPDGVLRVISMLDGGTVASFHADKQIVSAASDPSLRSIVALDQGANQLHYLRLEMSGWMDVPA